jgi:hypothetical protein
MASNRVIAFRVRHHTHNIVATLRQKLMAVAFFRRGLLMSDVIQLNFCCTEQNVKLSVNQL